MTQDWLADEADAALAAEVEMDEVYGEAETWEPKKGDELRGLLMGAKLISTKYGPSFLVNVKTEDGTYDVWVKASLRRALLDQKPGLRRGIVIKYSGKGQGDGYEYHKYSMASEPFTNERTKREAAQLWIDLAIDESKMAQNKEAKEEAKRTGRADPMEAPF